MAPAVGPTVHALAGVADRGADLGMALLDAGAQRATLGFAEGTQVELASRSKPQRRKALQHRPVSFGQRAFAQRPGADLEQVERIAAIGGRAPRPRPGGA